MRLLKNIKLDSYNYRYGTEVRKIFSIGYEDLTTQIYYQDSSKNFKLVVAKEDEAPLIVEKDISRAEAFRLMNTRF